MAEDRTGAGGCSLVAVYSFAAWSSHRCLTHACFIVFVGDLGCRVSLLSCVRVFGCSLCFSCLVVRSFYDVCFGSSLIAFKIVSHLFDYCLPFFLLFLFSRCKNYKKNLKKCVETTVF